MTFYEGIKPLERFVHSIVYGEIPEMSPVTPGSTAYDPGYIRGTITAQYEVKELANSLGMWGIVDKHWTADLAAWIGQGKVLEVMGGVGWLAKALSDHGVSIVCTDDRSWHSGPHRQAKDVFTVAKLDAVQAVEMYAAAADILLVSWPPYLDNEIDRAIELWGSDKPIIYIGELDHGCTASDSLFDIYEYEILDLPYPQWVGLNDVVTVGFYKPLAASTKKDKETMTDETLKTAQLKVRVTPAQKEAYKEAAKSAGLTMTDYIILACDAFLPFKSDAAQQRLEKALAVMRSNGSAPLDLDAAD